MNIKADPLFEYPADHERTNLPRLNGRYRTHCRCGLTSAAMTTVDGAGADLTARHGRRVAFIRATERL